MYHKVHLCISGCLTLKFSASWKTVISLSPASVAAAVVAATGSGDLFSLEIGVSVAADMVGDGDVVR